MARRHPSRRQQFPRIRQHLPMTTVPPTAKAARMNCMEDANFVKPGVTDLLGHRYGSSRGDPIPGSPRDWANYHTAGAGRHAAATGSAVDGSRPVRLRSAERKGIHLWAFTFP